MMLIDVCGVYILNFFFINVILSFAGFLYFVSYCINGCFFLLYKHYVYIYITYPNETPNTLLICLFLDFSLNFSFVSSVL